MLDENENNIRLTVDNIEFPVHFNHIKAEDGKCIDVFNNETIKKYIKEGVQYLRKNREEYSFGGYITGNLFLMIQRYEYDDEYEIYISNDFYEMQIDYNGDDYVAYSE